MRPRVSGHKRSLLLVLLGVLASLAATTGVVFAAAAAKTPGFSINSSPSSRSISQGQATTYSITVNASSNGSLGFTGSVTLAISGLPTGATGTFSPTLVAIGGAKSATSTLTVTTETTVNNGSFPLRITGTGTDTATKTSVTASTIETLGVDGFSLSAAPSTLSIAPGSAVSVTVAISRTNFSNFVGLFARGLPAGATAGFIGLPSVATGAVGFSPNPTTGPSSTLSVKISPSTPAGSYPVTISGYAFGAPTQTTTFTLVVTSSTVGSFTLGATPASAAALSGSPATYAVAVNRTNFTGAVTLSVTGGLPAGATASFSPNPASGSSSTLTVSTTTSTPLGTSTLTITGSAAGAATQMTTVQLTINPQTGSPFSITGSPAGLLYPGAAPQPINLTLTNPNSQPLNVGSLSVAIASSSFTTSCTANNYTVTQYSGPSPLTLQASQSASLSSLGVAPSAMPQIAMRETGQNQDACRSLPLKLTFTGTGQGN